MTEPLITTSPGLLDGRDAGFRRYACPDTNARRFSRSRRIDWRFSRSCERSAYSSGKV